MSFRRTAPRAVRCPASGTPNLVQTAIEQGGATERASAIEATCQPRVSSRVVMSVS